MNSYTIGEIFIKSNVEALYLINIVALTIFASVFSSVIYFIKDQITTFNKETLIIYSFISFFLFSAFLFFFSQDYNQINLFLLLIVSLYCAISLFHPTIAISSMVTFLVLRPWELFPEYDSFNFLPKSLLYLYFLSYFLNKIRTKKFDININKYQFGFSVLAFWIFLSVFVSGQIVEVLNSYTESFLKSIIVGFLIIHSIENKDQYLSVLKSLLFSVTGMGLYALVNTFYVVHTERLEGRGAIQNSNDLAALLILVIPIALRFIPLKKINLLNIGISLIALGCLIIGVWKAQSRAAYLALFLMGIGFLIYKFQSHKKLIIQIVISAVLVVGLLSQLKLGRDEGDLEESKMNRIGYWKAGWSMAIRHPILGVGFDQYPNHFLYYGVASFTETGKRTAHSSWVLLLAEAGFPALFIFWLLFYRALVKSWYIMKEAPELFYMLIGYGFCMSFLSHIYTMYPYIILSLVFAYPSFNRKWNFQILKKI